MALITHDGKKYKLREGDVFLYKPSQRSFTIGTQAEGGGGNVVKFSMREHHLDDKMQLHLDSVLAFVLFAQILATTHGFQLDGEPVVQEDSWKVRLVK